MFRILLHSLLACLVTIVPTTQSARAAADAHPLVGLAFELFSPIPAKRTAALAAIEQLNDKSTIPALILALRYQALDRLEIHEALKRIAGTRTDGTWHAWMIWQEQNPDIRAFEGFDRLLAAVMAQHDVNFARFIYRGMPHEIRLGEIAWGGVMVDGIPSLDNPHLVAAADAKYLNDTDLVFGVSINGDVRAYPLRILNWHEMFNDVIGGVPVALAYCTLCGSGILYETDIEGRDEAFVFGSSGFLYRSNKLMYDRQTYSLWNQFTGRPVTGPLTGSGIELKTRPVAITTWANWREANPSTRVLSLSTGHGRDYSEGAAYSDYFASDSLMFPADTSDKRLRPKDYVFALRSNPTEKAWPLSRFVDTPVINDTAGVMQLTLVGNASTKTVRAYQTTGQPFEPGDSPDTLLLNGSEWKVTEEALTGPDGATLPRLPGHVAYWFAWAGYLGQEGELAGSQ